MICSDKHSECWRCNQHILTIILWSHRIGVLTGEKDIRKVDYYQDKIDEIYDLDEALPLNASQTPVLASSFNEWRYEYMHEVTSFCMERDINPPDFIS